jgi:predicted nucleotidyltransferase
MNQRIQIDIPRTEIADFCKRHHIKKMAFFGSVLREDFHRQSDIDVLVEFETNHVPGLIRLAGMEIELSETFGQKVDLRTPEDLSRYFRQEVVESAEVIYAEE